MVVVVVNRMDAKTHTHTNTQPRLLVVVVVASGNFFAYYYCLLPYFSLSRSPRFLLGGGDGGNSMNSLKMMQTECRLKN